MAGGELLLELLSEEIPARMQRRAIEDLTSLVRGKLAAAETAAAGIQGYVTPRRLTVIADGIPARQPDRREERRGPRVGAPPQALDGFLRGAGLTSIDQCEVRDTVRGEFYFAVVQRPGRATADVLPELLHAAIAELPWPKSMRFPAGELRWVRPLNSVICLYDGEVLPLPLGSVPVGRMTRGHRFLSQGEIAVADAADYSAKLAAAHVILDHDRRRELIAAEFDRLAAAEGLRVKPDPGLLDEVAGLVEYPVPLMGKIDDASMALPPEVLATAMRTHQKYFTCVNADGSTAPRFLFVANNLTPDDGRTIVAGNERVLKARLADARFFWDQDRKIRLEDRVEALKDRVYYDKLGTMYDKTERMEKLAAFLAKYVPAAAEGLAPRAAKLAKADLSTGMVGEFPELQGIMGRYYALNDGEDQRITESIADHYRPLGPNDICPTAPLSIVIALADKLDALGAFFFINEGPTGSRDPFALRRSALGVVRIILENALRVPLFGAFDIVAKILGEPDQGTANALEFITERLEVHLRTEGVRHDVIKAAFLPTKQKGIEDDLVRLLARVKAIQGFLASDDGSNLLIAYRRASNIVAIEQRRDLRGYDQVVDPTLFRQSQEHALFADLSLCADGAFRCLTHEEFEAAMGHLASMRQSVDEFFDKVTVNTDEPELRENRLRLLSRIRDVMNQVADFSQIEG